MPADESKKKDTVPASRSARERLMPQASGVHRQVNESPVSGDRLFASDTGGRSADHEAHAEMERAVARGDCAIVSEVELDGGTLRQQSAWLSPEHRMVLDVWYRAPGGAWTRGVSLTISADGVTVLAELLRSRGF